MRFRTSNFYIFISIMSKKFAFKLETIVPFLALGALLFLLFNYSTKKSTSGYSNVGSYIPQPTEVSHAQAAPCDPSSLLPRDDNSKWGKMNPSGNGPLQNLNLMSAGSLIGINTVGSTLRNANLSERSEPPNPRMQTGPWNQSTIEPDTFRPALEIGCGAL